MPCSRFTALTLAVMGGLGALGFSRPSSACSPPPDGRYASGVPRTVPLDGVIVTWVRCHYNCPESAPVLVIKDKDTGEVLSGTQEEVADVPVREVETLLAFRPAAPLVDGHTYEVTVEQQGFGAEIWETRASAAVAFRTATRARRASSRPTRRASAMPSRGALLHPRASRRPGAARGRRAARGTLANATRMT
ncbi:hypothetical protein WMF04_49360 [Sorangium sp. So ce260]|uniref:hypothetical protein n=1 Tax=Sorangium sp. So ce260 TaxID=3133291 RepID=UPI003F5F8BAE